MKLVLNRIIRQEHRMTQQEVAARLNVDRSTVTHWEAGIAKPRAETLRKLARLYGCSMDVLLIEQF